MKKFLEYLVTSIVNHPQNVVIDEKEENNYLTLIIRVHPEDLKILIGKNGQTIKAIREIFRIKAIKEKKMVNIRIGQ
jgi:predicted RNA-binding protein YlqC (UPF0109 family)